MEKNLKKNQFSSVVQSCPTLCGPMECSTPGLPAHHQLWSLLKLMSIESVMKKNVFIYIYILDAACYGFPGRIGRDGKECCVLAHLLLFKVWATWPFCTLFPVKSISSISWFHQEILQKSELKEACEAAPGPFWNTLEAVALGCNELLPLLSPGTAQLHRSPHPQGYTSHYLSTSPSSTVCKMLWYLLFSPVSFRLWSCRTITGGAALHEELQFPT